MGVLTMDMIIQIIEAIKKLPVKCETFDDADRWVGCVVALQNLVAEEAKEPEVVTENGE